MPRSRKLWPPQQLTDGTAPDARFTLANERTFLAWIRTALGMIAAAVGLEAFAAEIIPGAVRVSVAVLLLAAAAVLGVYSFARWISVEGAMRTQRDIRGSAATVLLAGVVTIAGVAIAAAIVLW